MADIEIGRAADALVERLQRAGYEVSELVVAVEAFMRDGEPFRCVKGLPAERPEAVGGLVLWAAHTLISPE